MRTPSCLPFELEDVPPEKWPETPVVIHHNSLTNLGDGDDSGYRDVPRIVTVKPEPLVRIDGDMYVTPELDGVNMYGRPDDMLKMGGGIEGGGILLRETIARTLRAMNAQIRKVFGGQFELVPADGYRSAVRQQSVFKFMFRRNADAQKIDLGTVTDEQLLTLGRFTETNASAVSLKNNEIFLQLIAELEQDSGFLPQFQGTDRNAAVRDYISVSANTGIGRAKHIEIETDTATAHGGAGAVDLNIWGPSPINGKRVPLVHTPAAFAHSMSGTLFLENDANFDVFKQLWIKHEEVRKHMAELGYDSPDTFTFERDWNMLRMAHRVRHHSFINLGVRGSFYDPNNPNEAGENWHYQIGNIATVDGVVYASPQSAATHPGSGNTCHVKLRQPAGSEAVWGAKDAFAYVEDHYGHTPA